MENSNSVTKTPGWFFAAYHFVLGVYPYNLAGLLRQVHDDTLVFGELH
jgi:hypothetical protein